MTRDRPYQYQYFKRLREASPRWENKRPKNNTCPETTEIWRQVRVRRCFPPHIMLMRMPASPQSSIVLLDPTAKPRYASPRHAPSRPRQAACIQAALHRACVRMGRGSRRASGLNRVASLPSTNHGPLDSSLQVDSVPFVSPPI